MYINVEIVFFCADVLLKGHQNISKVTNTMSHNTNWFALTSAAMFDQVKQRMKNKQSKPI